MSSSPKKDEFKHLWKAIQDELINRLWFGMFLISIIGAPLSALRFLQTGWLAIYAYHILVGLCCVVVYLTRNSISSRVKVYLLIGVFFGIGVSGLLMFGLLGAGFWWLALSSFLAGSLLSLKIGIYFSIFNILLISLTSALFLTDTLTLPVSADEYVKSITSWASFLVAAVIMPIFVLISIATYQVSTHELLIKLERQKQQIEKLASHDQLTGLLLLNLASDRLEQAILRCERPHTKFALLFLDLDGFKLINDTYGHDVGDFVLCEIAKRLRSISRKEDSIARVGGDEFLILIENVKLISEVESKAERIIRAISKPILYAEEKLMVGCSLGIAIYPDHAITIPQLKKAADKAMYTVKKSGKNGYAFADYSKKVTYKK